MLAGKVVIVTGGGKGIGRHAAKTFAEKKAKVVVVDFDNERLQGTVKELGGVNEALGIQADVRSEDDVRKMVDLALGRFGQIDVLVNNAALVPHFAWNIPRWPLISDMPKEFWDGVIQTNLNGTFLCTKHVIPHMAKRKSGHIINLYGGGGRGESGNRPWIRSSEKARRISSASGVPCSKSTVW